MVKKLLKHELYALFRILIFIAAAAVLFAVLSRVLIYVNMASYEKTAGNLTVVLFLVIFFYIIAICALVTAAWALGISRFYKTLFTGEGYMTLSLPVTPMQLIWAKLLSSLIAMAFASVVSILSLGIFLIGWNSGIMESIGGVFGELFGLLAEFLKNEPLYLVEYLILGIVSIPMSLLVVYAIICVGQMFTSRRGVLTVLIVFGVYTVSSLFNAFALTPLMNVFVDLGDVGTHLSLWLQIVMYVAVDVGCFFLVRYILKNKVNLIA